MFANGRCRAWLLILLGRVSPVSGNFQSRKTGTKPPMFFFTLPSLRFFVPFDPVVRLFFARFKCSLEKRNVDRIVDSFRYSNRAPFLGNGWERNYFNKRNIIIKSFIPVIYYEWKEKMRHNLKWKMIYNEVYYTWSIVYRRIYIYIYIHMCHWFLLLLGRDWMSIYRIYLSRWWGMDVWMAKWVSLTRAICRLVYEIDVNYDWIRSWWMLRN